MSVDAYIYVLHNTLVETKRIDRSKIYIILKTIYTLCKQT